jgi:TM2 domain-containing membrane protein YozV
MGKFYFLVLFIVCTSFIASGSTRVAEHSKSTILVHHVLQSKLIAHSNDTDTVVVHHRKRKLFAALLAFPLGVFGFHRMYLGTTAGVPFLYIASLGGVFGILPFADFIQIILCKDVNVYAHKSSIFMWHKTEK